VGGDLCGIEGGKTVSPRKVQA